MMREMDRNQVLQRLSGPPVSPVVSACVKRLMEFADACTETAPRWTLNDLKNACHADTDTAEKAAYLLRDIGFFKQVAEPEDTGYPYRFIPVTQPPKADLKRKLRDNVSYMLYLHGGRKIHAVYNRGVFYAGFEKSHKTWRPTEEYYPEEVTGWQESGLPLL